MKIGFLFDNDGVLIDSTELHFRAWELLMGKERDLKLTREDFLRTFGKRNDLILKELLPHSTDEQRAEWAKEKEALFRGIARNRIALLDGMEDFLKLLQKRNIPRIIASSTPIENLEMYIETTVLSRYFDRYVSAEEVKAGKPAPDIFLEAARRLGMRPRDCIVLEDAQAGIDAGKAAHCFVVALETTYPKAKLKNYDLIYPSPKELSLDEIVQNWQDWSKNVFFNLEK